MSHTVERKEGLWSLLKGIIDAYKKNDPAATNALTILLTYPGLKAIFSHRIAHFFIEDVFFFLLA